MNTRITKESIAKIIANNRRPFAVHQLWAIIDNLERQLKEARKVAKP